MPPDLSVEVLKKPFEVATRRLYLPIVLRGTCPKCSATFSCSFENHSVSFPMINEKFDYNCHCYSCGHEWVVQLMLQLRAEVTA